MSCFLTEKIGVQIRWLLSILSLFVFLLIFMVKNSFGVIIVAMVNSTNYENDTQHYLDTCPNLNDTTQEMYLSSSGELLWSNAQQSYILGAYTWGLALSKVLGGRLGELYGQRLVVAIGLAFTGIIQILSPTISFVDPSLLFTSRFLIGCCSGPIFSAFQSLMSKWAPRHQLASIISTSIAGFAIGGMVGVVTASWIVEKWGWRWVFWSEGFVVLSFVPLWIFMVRNDPKDHPYITPYELKILEENRCVTTQKNVPWKKILMSPYLHVCILAQFCRSWLDGVQNVEGPIYFHRKLGLNLSYSSLIVGVTSIVGLPSLLLYGRLSDWIIRRQYVSRLGGRRCMHLIGAGIAAILFLQLAYAGCNSTMVVIFWVLTGLIIPATAVSFNVSIIDFAPNYAGTFMGLIGVGDIGTSLSPMVTSALVQQAKGWDNVFFVCAGINALNCLVYIFVMTDQPQSWNYDDSDTNPTVEDSETRMASTIQFEMNQINCSTHL